MSQRTTLGLALLVGSLLLCLQGGGLAARADEATAIAPSLSTARASIIPPGLLDAPATWAGTTYYVRPDGGSHAQCNGRFDAPYTGGSSDCAWNHPFQALPPDGTPRIAGGDTLFIASGSYMMGYGAPGADNCESDWPYGCVMPPIPAGPSPSQPTRILGQGWASGCANPPELWGTERAYQIMDLTDSDNVVVACLEITDHSECVEFHSGALTCERDNYPYGPWASVGLYAQDAENVTLSDLNIHGLASAGIHAGRLTDWTVEDVRIAGNGWVGWDGDMPEGSDSNAGTLRFNRWTVEWNGCGETYPGEAPTGCWGQSAGGYGDGVGTGATGGDWIISDSEFSYNTSDGLDLLYHSEGGSIHLDRVRAEGNAGNPVKVTGHTMITNSVLVGNCAFFEGKPYTYWVDHCRALGNTLELTYTGGETVSLVNSTLYAQGDGLIGAGAREGHACTGAETLRGRNNILIGDDDYNSPGDVAFVFYQEGCAGLAFDSDYSMVHGGKDSLYVPGAHDMRDDPELVGPLSGERYGMALTADSPAIDAGTAAGAPLIDITRSARSGAPDLGAYEYGAATIWQLALPAVWNLVSLPVAPLDTAPSSVLASLSGSYDLAAAYDATLDAWDYYVPGDPGGTTLGAIDEGTPFWVKMTRADTLVVAGTAPSQHTQALTRGWNLVAYPASESRPVAEALASIAGRYTTVYGHAAGAGEPWRVYSTASPAWANTLSQLDPGAGYWVEVTEDCVLTIAY